MEGIMSDKILIANARESWSQACIHSNLILDGYVTLQYKKMFVSTLHNSVELLMKQRMLDLNDYRIVKIRKIDSNGEPAKSFYSATDLNSYFQTNGTKDGKGKPLYYSIEFHDLGNLHKEIFKDYYDVNPNEISLISTGLALLDNLRNDETHFYVKDMDFMNGTEFKTLQTFMVAFAKVLEFYNLLPTHAEGVTTKIKPNQSIPTRSDYRLFLKGNNDIKTIATYLNGKACRGECTAFDIIDFLWFCSTFDKKTINCQYTEAISLMSGVVQYNLVKIKKKEEQRPDGTTLEFDAYEFNI